MRKHIDLELLLLASLEISNRKIQNLINVNKNAEQLLSSDFINGISATKFFTSSEIDKIKKAIYDNKLEGNQNILDKHGVSFVTILDSEYPKLLSEIDNPPCVLFYKGNFDITSLETISVVGTRKPNAYGREVTEKFVSALSREGFCIVSGLAYGVDTISHQTAIKENAKTVAVLANGLDMVYPAENEYLASKIVESGGCLISECFVGIKPEAFRFPARNRIVSGLSRGILVTQASEKSGSLITASLAIEQNRDLFVVPANINMMDSKGTNKLIAKLPDCVCFDPARIVLTYRKALNEKNKQIEIQQLGYEESSIIECLKDGEKSFDEILEFTKLNSKILNQKLTTLEINEIIKRISGNVYEIKENL